MSQVHATLDHLFRREFGKTVGRLTRFLGPSHLDLAENAVQEAMLKAVQSWPLNGTPENPTSWILRVAKNAAIDQIRKSKNIDFEDSSLLESLEDQNKVEYFSENEIKDDQLKLMFICCHPILPKESRVALTLKTVCGFSVEEIAKGFLTKPETIAQRIVRAKRKISSAGIRFEVPDPSLINERLDSVLEVLYLLFNEGYSATSGDSLIRKDLCDEAVFRLSHLILQPICQLPKVFALLALMHFQISRFNARTDNSGELLLLEEQDRGVWDKEHIAKGLKYLELASEGDELTTYHLEAGIASCHAIALRHQDTDWKTILNYYDILEIQNPSSIVSLNKAVALAMVEGYAEGLRALNRIKNRPQIKTYYLLYATFGEMHRRLGEFFKAKGYYETALNLVGTEPEKRLLSKRIETCNQEIINNDSGEKIWN
ncbi:MAG: RNA polymerase sigma factor [Bdellovibrionales bacterium]|nr:RNA polymerase sigma factor [Bdellovibrionales bacterium]